MKRILYIILFIFILLLCSCKEERPVAGYIIEKDKKDAYDQKTVRMIYTGSIFVPRTYIIHHQAQYWIVIEDEDKAKHTIYLKEDIWNQVEINQFIYYNNYYDWKIVLDKE